MKRIKAFAATLLAIALMIPLAACGDGAGTSKYPSQVITMIVNYSAGGGTDLAARAIADAAAKELGGNITYQNLTGGSGTVGVTSLAQAKNDGYTIGVATLSPLALVPYQLEVTYTPDDFEYICAFSQYSSGGRAGSSAPPR